MQMLRSRALRRQQAVLVCWGGGGIFCSRTRVCVSEHWSTSSVSVLSSSYNNSQGNVPLCLTLSHPSFTSTSTSPPPSVKEQKSRGWIHPALNNDRAAPGGGTVGGDPSTCLRGEGVSCPSHTVNRDKNLCTPCVCSGRVPSGCSFILRQTTPPPTR